jgi:hypothetical protein
MQLDDNGTPDLDKVLADFDPMENIEIHIFNPFPMHSPKLLSGTLPFSGSTDGCTTSR